VPPPRTSWRRRPLLALIILILLLVIGYIARDVHGGKQSGSQRNGTVFHSHSVSDSQPVSTQPAQDGGRFAAKAAIPS
jgi:hypothetical protein